VQIRIIRKIQLAANNDGVNYWYSRGICEIVPFYSRSRYTELIRLVLILWPILQ